ncbi:MAG: DNA primase [bacterium]
MSQRTPQHIIEEIKDRTSIKEVVEDYVRLQKDGANYKGLCPFHNEKTPSFKVHDEKGIFKCFGCGESGNVFTFLMKKEGMNFHEALKTLAERAGVSLPEREVPEEEKEKERQNERIFEANLAAARLFRNTLLESEQGQKARDYLDQRGLSQETIKRYGLGYAPGGWSTAMDSLVEKGIEASDLYAAGLIIPRKQGGGYYDRFRERLMFPIMDVQGRVRGFGGRLIEDHPDQPKYLNTPETPVFKKGSGFFGLYQAKEAIRKTNRAVIVEGYMDQIALHQAGIPYAVATLGTALTREHAYALKRYAADVFMVFDPDEAGTRASFRSLEVFLEGGLSPRVVIMPEGKDPDDFIRSHSREEFESLLEESPPLLRHYMNHLLRQAGGTPRELSRAVAEAAEMIGRVQDPIERNIFVQELAEASGIPAADIKPRLKKPKRREEAGEGEKAGQGPESYNSAELDLVRVLINHPETATRVRQEELASKLESVELAGFVQNLIDTHADTGKLDPAAYIQKISDPALSDWITRVILEDDPFAGAIDKVMNDLAHTINHRHLMQLMQKNRIEMNQAHQKGDLELWRSLLEKQQDLENRQRRLAATSADRRQSP